jgi:hypothetical protein
MRFLLQLLITRKINTDALDFMVTELITYLTITLDCDWFISVRLISNKQCKICNHSANFFNQSEFFVITVQFSVITVQKICNNLI